MRTITPHFLQARVVQFERWLGNPAVSHVGFFSALAVLAVGAFDYWQSSFFKPEVTTLSFLYALPISATALFVGMGRALLLSLFSVAISIGGDYLAGFHAFPEYVPFLNGLLRFLFFVYLTLVLTWLKRLHINLEQRVQDRVYELAHETAERERLECEILAISERERRVMGRDLHDGLCQHLTGTAMVSHSLAENPRARSEPEAEVAQRVVNLLEEGIGLARSMAKGLHPVDVQPDGLMEALEEFAETTSELFGVHCRFECHVPVLIHSPSSATQLYRIVQEAVSNAIRHGNATNIIVSLEEIEAGTLLAVIDNGHGFAGNQQCGKGIGLQIMADRAKLIGAQFSVRAGHPHGVELNCLVPLPGSISLPASS